jgi:pimeloyl-ACP methyl ester carboxylesterase
MYADTPVSIPAAGVTLEADLSVPQPARGLIVFAHGSGSSRHSPRNRMVAARLHDSGFATVLADLLTLEEERGDARTGALRFDIELLADRVTGIMDWAGELAVTRRLAVGLFGASTGAAAALVAAARRPERVRAVVSRGGRPDLAGEALTRVVAPTLLIVGGEDHQVVRLNQQAAERLGGAREMEMVPRATHLFAEPGALEQVAMLAAAWFSAYLGIVWPAETGEPVVDDYPEWIYGAES